MKKLLLKKVNPGNYSKDKTIYERLKSFNNGIVEISRTTITVKSKDSKTFTSKLQMTEEDFMSVTFQGNYEDGTKFRLISPAGVSKTLLEVNGKNDYITFGGMTGDGYALTFDIVDENEPDKTDFEESRNTNFTSAAESKAETLVMTTDTLKEINPKMAKEHISRFINLLEQNEIEIVKFEHIQNIIYGYVLAVNLSVIDEDAANEKLNELKLCIHSKSHSRFDGKMVYGPSNFPDSARRIEIVPNYDLKEGYIVTVHNKNGIHPLFGKELLAGPFQMKLNNNTENEIKLIGFGTDSLGNPFSDYKLTITLKDNDIDYVKLAMENDVVMTYFK